MFSVASLSFACSLLACSSSSSPAGAQPADASAGDTSADVSASDASATDASAADAGADTALPPWYPDATSPDAAALVAARPYTLHVPTGYDASKRTPLVVLFHGFGHYSGAIEDAYMAITIASDAHGFLYAYGDGTLDKDGNRFWNGTDACCDLYGTNVDDVAYFNAIVDDVNSKYDVDPRQIFVVGHSNGAFMAHRLSCAPGSRVAAIVRLAGA